MIAGSTSVLTITNVQLADLGEYSVLFTSPYGIVTSKVARLSLIVPPVITKQPVDVPIHLGETAVFSAAGEGTMPLNSVALRVLPWKYSRNT